MTFALIHTNGWDCGVTVDDGEITAVTEAFDLDAEEQEHFRQDPGNFHWSPDVNDRVGDMTAIDDWDHGTSSVEWIAPA